MSFPTGAEGESLSVFQLQKDIWAKAEELGKEEGKGKRGPSDSL